MLELHNLIVTPAPSASILVAIAKDIKQRKEMHLISTFSSFLNVSNKNFKPKNINTANTIHFEYAFK